MGSTQSHWGVYAFVPPKQYPRPSSEYGMSSRMYLGLQVSTGRVISIQDKLTIIIIIWPQHSLLSLTKDPAGATAVKSAES